MYLTNRFSHKKKIKKIIVPGGFLKADYVAVVLPWELDKKM